MPFANVAVCPWCNADAELTSTKTVKLITESERQIHANYRCGCGAAIAVTTGRLR